MDLSVFDDASLLAMYTEAVQALAALLTGQREMSVSITQGAGGRSVSFSQASLPDLRAWIAQLLAALTARGLMAPQRPSRRAIGIRYG